MKRLISATLPLLSWLLGELCPKRPYLSLREASALIDGSIKVGMNRPEVIRRLGRPKDTQIIGEAEFLFYPTSGVFALMASQHDPIAIVDGKVAGFGQAYYENATAGAGIAMKR